MDRIGDRPRMRARPHREPGPRRAWLRTQWRHISEPWRWLRAEKLRLMARASVEKARPWGGRNVWGWTLVAAAWLGSLLFMFRVYVEFFPVSVGWFRVPPAEHSVYHSGYDLATAILAPFALVGLTYVIFLLRHVITFRSPYRKDAIKRPQDLVQTSGTILGEIVGRDDLCRAIMEDLRNCRTRRPHVIVGGVGAGKTAMLVRLTTLLAQKGAVPVPVRLRDCDKKLEFREAAYDRFCELAELYGFHKAKADRVWQQLCNDNKIVVLADGLEEALQELGEKENERDNMIRVAIHRARVEKLPVIIASRPHAPLRGMEASMTELEPLGERDALLYLRRRGRNDEDARLQWIVETAEVSEAPLYLQITDELNAAELLHHIAPRQDRDQLDTRDADRIGLRWRLLATWVKAVIDGYLHEEVLLDDRARQATVEQLSALACAGLMKDTLEVGFSEFGYCPEGLRKDGDETEDKSPERPKLSNRAFCEIREKLISELRSRHSRLDFQLAAAYGQQLGLVEFHGNALRFPNSMMQAYLGSRYIGTAMSNSYYRQAALKELGREFLMALVMYTRSRASDVTKETMKAEAGCIVDQLLRQARIRTQCENGPMDKLDVDELDVKKVFKLDVKTLELYASAVQIMPESDHRCFTSVVSEVAKLIAESQERQEIVTDDHHTFEKARLSFVARLGEAMRRVMNKPDADKPEVRNDLKGAYCALFDLGRCEPSYAVRLAVAQEIGSSGDLAFDALESELAPPATVLGQTEASKQQKPNPVPTQDELPAAREEEQEERQLRRQVMRAWLMPMLAASVTPAEERRESESREHTERRHRQAWVYLDRWLDYVASPGTGEPFLVNVEIALAQGFKYAANWRRLNPYSPPQSRTYMAERAKDMLHRVDFWYSRLTLLHALTLWSLPDGPDDHRDRQPQSPDALVRQWLVMRNDEAARAKTSRIEHPFVAQAARLCVLALETGQPERFLWIDGSGILSKTGSGPSTTAVTVRRHLWIPPSAGWSALDPRAQQLVADLLIFLNLAEGGRGPKERERRLAETARPILPWCLTRDRTPLDPVQTVGVARRRGLASRSGCASDCLFDLCPYPPKGVQLRAELSEAFCRRQRVILGIQGRIRSLRLRATAPWQGETKTDLRQFWDSMGARSRR